MIDWKSEIEEFMIRTIDLYLKYHMSGKLERIKLYIISMEYVADITLVADGHEKKIDFYEFRLASEECERDAQRECYFENESIWGDFFTELEGTDRMKACLKGVADALENHYGVKVSLELED